MMDVVSRVKDAARGQWLNLLPEFGGFSPAVLDGNHHPCPKCGGEDRFRLIDADAGAVLCNQCFNQKNGDGIAAIQWLRDQSFQEVLEALRKRFGIEEEKKASKLEILGWNETIALSWTLHKKGILPLAVQANGGVIARWRKRFTVVALPILARVGQPTGWVMWNSTGEMLPKNEEESSKILVSKGSKAGWIGSWALERLDQAELVWKVEGPSDMLALWSAIPEELREKHIVLSNAFGGNERPKEELARMLFGKRIAIIPDCDPTGLECAARWQKALMPFAAEILTATLPPGEWKDVRDWLVAGGSYAELLARTVAVVMPPSETQEEEKPAEKLVVDDGTEGQADDDPARLALVYLKQRRGRVMAYLEEIYFWRNDYWRGVPEGDFEQEIYPYVQQEFYRVYLELKKEKANREGPPVRQHKITKGLVNSVVSALKAFCGLPTGLEWGTELSEPDEFGRMEPLEKRRWISCKNGILDVDALLEGKEKILLPHTPRWFSPHILPYAFDPTVGAAHRPRWEDFLARNLEGDSERIGQLQEWAGYILLPQTTLQAFLIVEGEGANGKSVYLAVLEALLGPENVSHVPLEIWSQRFALMPTLGKLLNVASEVGDLDKVAEGYLKAFVAGDAMTFDRKGLDPVEARPTARLVIATNNRPRFSDRSKGLWRRMLLVPFLVEIPQGERVLGMDKPEWWYQSGEMPAIFNWALEGLQRLLIQGKFSECKRSQQAIEEYQTETNPAREILIDNCDEVPDGMTWSIDLYRLYSKKCEEYGYRALGNAMFFKEVKRVFPVVTRIQVRTGSTRAWAYKGILIRAASGQF